MKKGCNIVFLFFFMILILLLQASAENSSTLQPSQKSIQEQCEIILSSSCLEKGKVGVSVISLEKGKIIYEKNADLPLIPASNMKIITSAAALNLLKPEYRFQTTFHHDGYIENGVLKGNLYIKGHGAPDLVGEMIWIMLKEFTQSGIIKIEGDLIGDGSYFDNVERPLSWPKNIGDDPYSAPIGALSCNFNSVRVVIKPGQIEEKPIIHLSPFSDFFKIINKAKTKDSKSSLSVKRIYSEGENRILVQGTISSSGEFSEYKSVENPTFYMLSSAREILRTLGVTITGVIKVGTIPPHAKDIFTYRSRPLSKIIYDMNKNSNNFMAEMILKALGAEVIGPPGTTEKGLKVLELLMKNVVKDSSSLKLLDGSGLSKGNRLSADSLMSVLIFMEDQFGEGYDFAASLPIGGSDGTLKNRFKNETIARSLRGKTGYLNGVASLSGYLENKEGERFAFSILINQPKCGSHKSQEIIDNLCMVIAGS